MRVTPEQFRQLEARTKRTRWEDAFADLVKAAGLPDGVREYRWHPTRRFRFDFAWPTVGVAVEVEGGTWGRVLIDPATGKRVRSGGRHQTGTGFKDDCEKYNLAALESWCVLRVTPDQIKSGEAVKWLETALFARRANP